MEYNFNKDANGQISKDTTASIDGLYLIECLGDNHTFSGLFKYKKGERIWTYFEGYERTSGWFGVKPLNILNIVLETDTEWKQGEIAPTYGLYIVAYAFQDCLEAYYGYHSTESIQYDKKNYALILAAQGDNFLDILVKSRGPRLKSEDDEVKWENARVLAYYIVRDDSDVMRKYFAVQETENEKKRISFKNHQFYREFLGKSPHKEHDEIIIDYLYNLSKFVYKADRKQHTEDCSLVQEVQGKQVVCVRLNTY